MSTTMMLHETTCSGNDKSMPYGLRMAQKRFRSKPYERKRMVAAYGLRRQIFLGENQRRTHPLAKRFGHLYDRIHAELNAIIIANRSENIINGTVYVYRERANGQLGQAAPCESCRALLKSYNVRRVIYSTPTGYTTEYL